MAASPHPQAPQVPEVPEMEVSELARRLDQGQPLVLVDVREAFEARIADLPDLGQRRIPMGELEARVGELDPDGPTVVYCRSGARSAWATRYLRERGFENVVNLRGGIMAWRAEVDPSLRAY